MRASRLVELLLLLQIRGGAPATELATALEVSVRTIYRDVEALGAAGIPVYAEVGRNGGIRIDPAYRVAGLPRLDAVEAQGLLFAIVPAIADQLGFDASAADRTLLPAMEASAETAARSVRDRLLVEPTHWFVPPDDTSALADVATAVWESREARLTYRGADVVVRPLGLILKGATWYLLGGVRRGGDRLFRLSRVEAVELLDHRFERPADFDLEQAWTERREAFLDSMPEYPVTVRIAPAAEWMLPSMDEARVDVPLADDVERDEHGWARLRLMFETPQRATRHLLRLGTDVEVLDPPELRDRMADTALGLTALYGAGA